jgi:hypothetical protein
MTSRRQLFQGRFTPKLPQTSVEQEVPGRSAKAAWDFYFLSFAGVNESRRYLPVPIVPSYCWVGGWSWLFGASVSSDLTSLVLRRISW